MTRTLEQILGPERTATADDVVCRLRDSLYETTAETSLGWGMGNVSPRSIRTALNAAIADGRVEVVEVRDTTYGDGVRFVVDKVTRALRRVTVTPYGEASAFVILDGKTIGEVSGSTLGLIRGRCYTFPTRAVAVRAVVSAHLLGYWTGER